MVVPVVEEARLLLQLVEGVVAVVVKRGTDRSASGSRDDVADAVVGEAASVGGGVDGGELARGSSTVVDRGVIKLNLGG